MLYFVPFLSVIKVVKCTGFSFCVLQYNSQNGIKFRKSQNGVRLFIRRLEVAFMIINRLEVNYFMRKEQYGTQQYV